MKNWAGNIQFEPAHVHAPTSTQEAQTIIKKAINEKKKIRMRGTGHSWTGLIETNDSFFHLDNMQGILSVDQNKKLITAKAGTKLSLFGEEAFKHKMALPNQGDINHQSLAGALSTGTHGTGITLQSAANQIHGMTLITGTGEILTIDEEKNPEMIKAFSVSMGSTGLITEATIKMRDAYKLMVETFAEDMDVSLQKFSSRLHSNRHLEMFYFPVGDWSMVKLMNETNEKETTTGINKVMDEFLENWLYEGFNILAGKTGSYKKVDAFMRRFVSPKTSVNWSHRAFPTARTIRFMEMEYNLPVEKFEEVFAEMKACIKKNNFQTLFPIEIRFVKSDDLWLSPAYKRDSVYFAVHTYVTENYRPYFEEMQKIFTRHGGRPHWGKWHNQTSKYFETVYPKWHEFLKLRSELDPHGTWLNNHLATVFHSP
jgi:FAD-linked oxidoreductase